MEENSRIYNIWLTRGCNVSIISWRRYISSSTSTKQGGLQTQKCITISLWNLNHERRCWRSSKSCCRCNISRARGRCRSLAITCARSGFHTSPPQQLDWLFCLRNDHICEIINHHLNLDHYNYNLYRDHGLILNYKIGQNYHWTQKVKLHM